MGEIMNLIDELNAKIEKLEKEVAVVQQEKEKLSKMLEMAMTDALSQSHYAECNGSVYGLGCENIDEYRKKLEIRMSK